MFDPAALSRVTSYSAVVSAPGCSALGALARASRRPIVEDPPRSSSSFPLNWVVRAALCWRKPPVEKGDNEAIPRAPPPPQVPASTDCPFHVPKLPPATRNRAVQGSP